MKLIYWCNKILVLQIMFIAPLRLSNICVSILTDIYFLTLNTKTAKSR